MSVSPRGFRSRARSRVASLIAAPLVMLAVAAAPAHAHSALVTGSPAAGSTLTAGPSKVVLNFNESVTVMGKNIISVTSPIGDEMVKGSTAAAGPVVQAALAQFKDEGAYVVSYRVISADGHEITGSYAFNYYKTAAVSSPSSGSGGSAASARPKPSLITQGSGSAPIIAPGKAPSPAVTTDSSGGAAGPVPASPVTRWVMFAVLAAALYVSSRLLRKWRRKMRRDDT